MLGLKFTGRAARRRISVYSVLSTKAKVSNVFVIAKYSEMSKDLLEKIAEIDIEVADSLKGKNKLLFYVTCS